MAFQSSVQKDGIRMATSSSNSFRPRNILDSTAPKPRGKERQIPKAKKPKTFRRRINQEKEDLKEDATVNCQSLSATGDNGNLNEKSCKPTDQGSSNSDSSIKNVESDNVDLDLLSQKFTKIDLQSNGLDALVNTILHPPYHREYVRQVLTNQMEFTTYLILRNLIRFQDRVFHRNPEKLQIKRRYICGFNQVNKFVRLNKAKAVIIAPDIQRILKDGVLDQTVENLITSCEQKKIPVIFTSTRNRLAIVCCKNPKSHLSCIAILDYGGTQDEFNRLINDVKDARETYERTRFDLISHLESLSESQLQEIHQFLKERNQIPRNLQQYRDQIHSPLRRNIYVYINLIKQQTGY